MNFVLVLIATVLEFTVSSSAALRQSRWSADWAGWCERIGCRRGWWADAGGGWPALLILVLPPALVVALLVAAVSALSPLLGHVASLLVLILMLGPEDLVAQVAVHKRAGNFAFDGDEIVPDFLRETDTLDFTACAGAAAPNGEQLELAALALAAERAWFAPLFWFFAGGPLAVVFYRHTVLLRALAITPRSAHVQLLEALEFVPARISVLAFGLVGTLVPVVDCARRCGALRWGVSRELLARAALAAADDGGIYAVTTGDGKVYRLNMMLALLKRAVLVWLLFFAGLSLLGL